VASDSADMWRDVRKHAQAKRASNRQGSADVLRREGIAFEARNDGAHLIVSVGERVADFWPGTGLFQVRGGKRGRGVCNLVKQLRALERGEEIK
jgi:hypothetical protein